MYTGKLARLMISVSVSEYLFAGQSHQTILSCHVQKWQHLMAASCAYVPKYMQQLLAGQPSMHMVCETHMVNKF